MREEGENSRNEVLRSTRLDKYSREGAIPHLVHLAPASNIHGEYSAQNSMTAWRELAISLFYLLIIHRIQSSF